MKKIVALVLSLALVLALCTVAFAKIGGTTFSGYDYCTIAGGKLGTATHTDLIKVDATANNIAYWIIGEQEYVETKTPGEGDVAVIAMNDTSKAVLFYLHPVTAVAASETVPEGGKIVKFNDQLTKDEKACGKYYLEGFDSAKTYYAILDKDGKVTKVYVEGGEQTLLIDGALVKVTQKLENPTAIAHNWVGANFDAKTGEPASAKCSRCGATAKLTKDYAVAKAAGTFEMFSDNVRYVYGFGTAAAPATGVTSAKTFDAGVAMYAGLALMSVAGSAVVIGKKKEF